MCLEKKLHSVTLVRVISNKFHMINEANLTRVRQAKAAVRINLGCATPIAGLGRLVCQYLHFRSRNYVRLDACVNTSCRVDPQLAGTYHLWSSPIRPNYVNKRLAQAYV